MLGSSKEIAYAYFESLSNVIPPEFSLSGVKTWARVVSIHDGDTLKAVIPLHDRCYAFPLRLHGIDTCELKSKDAQNKELALKARNRLYELVTQRPWPTTLVSASKSAMTNALQEECFLVWLECGDFDKYGRLLATIRAEQEGASFADILVSEKLAYVYGGDTKLTEAKQIALLMSMHKI